MLKSNSLKKFLAVAITGAMTLTVLSACGNKNANVTDDKGRTIVSVGGWSTKEGKQTEHRGEKAKV